jgi:RHS repeat-associated protein
VYDGDGNRVSETAAGVTTKYLVDTMNSTGLPQVVDELVNGSVTRTYAYGMQRISENQLIGGVWTPSFYGYDGHGSVRFLTNTNALVTDTYEYDAFGNLLASTGSTPNNYLFAGEQFDPALGIYQMRARWYRETTGRFISRDPLEGAYCTPLSWNSYIFSLADPVDNSDATGLATAVAPLPVEEPPTAAPEKGGGGGAIGEYALVVAAVLSAGVAGSERLAETIICGAEYLGSKAKAYVVGGPNPTLARVARCLVEAKEQMSRRRRGNSDPIPNPGKSNPGPNPNEPNGCNKCPPDSPYWPQMGAPGTHGCPSGLHYHWYHYNQ